MKKKRVAWVQCILQLRNHRILLEGKFKQAILKKAALIIRICIEH